MSPAQTLDHGLWLAGRSAGLVAYLLLSASVVLGFSMALRLVPLRLTPALRGAHERIALLARGGVTAHALLLLGDGWLRPGLSLVVMLSCERILAGWPVRARAALPAPAGAPAGAPPAAEARRSTPPQRLWARDAAGPRG